MTFYENIYEVAADNYGFITATVSKTMGISDKEMPRLAKDGRLARIDHGVYWVKHHISEQNDPYAACVTLVGSGAHLFGKSVIAMHGLTPTDPAKMYVATLKRIRKTLPGGIEVIHRPVANTVTDYEGISSQSTVGAILSCRKTMMADRLVAETHEAQARDLIRTSEEKELLEELEGR